MHEVVRAIRPDARVVYVDHDEVAVAYARRLLPTDGRTVVLRATCGGPASCWPTRRCGPPST